MNGLSCGKHKENKRKRVLLKYTKIVISEKISHKCIDSNRLGQGPDRCLKIEGVFLKMLEIITKDVGKNLGI